MPRASAEPDDIQHERPPALSLPVSRQQVHLAQEPLAEAMEEDVLDVIPVPTEVQEVGVKRQVLAVRGAHSALSFFSFFASAWAPCWISRG